MAVEQYNTMKNASDLVQCNSVEYNKSLPNTFSNNLSSNLDSNITYSDGKEISYSGNVPALNDSKVKQIIKNEDIDKIVTMASEKYNIPERLIYKVIETESYFDKNCTSGAGAKGLMQLMPENCKAYGVTTPSDPYQNIMAGTKILRENINAFNGDLKLGLAAYNAGPGNVRKYGGVPPFKETQNYVKKILG